MLYLEDEDKNSEVFYTKNVIDIYQKPIKDL